MNMKMKKVAGACLCAAVIVGCVSIDETRMQLKSSDPALVSLAQENILKIVAGQKISSPFSPANPEQYLELTEGNEFHAKILRCSDSSSWTLAALNKLDSSKPGIPNDVLLQILDRHQYWSDNVLLAAAGKLDFSKAGLAMEILTKHKKGFEAVVNIQQASSFSQSSDFADAVLNKLSGPELVQLLKGDFGDAMKMKSANLLNKLNEQELLQLLKGGYLGCDIEKKVVLRLLSMTQNNATMFDIYDGELGKCLDDGQKQKALRKLLANADKISDKTIVVKLLASKEVTDEAIRKKLISRLPSDEAEIYTLNECKDDKAFYEAFKKARKEVKEKVFGRVLMMKDESLLADFVRNNPSAAHKVDFRFVKTPELAAALLDSVEEVLLEGSYTYGTMHSTVDWFVFELVQKLDAKGRAKYLKAAKENLETAKKDNIVLCDKFYVNMPALDYVMISFEEGLAWTKKPGAVIDYLDGYADMKTDIRGKDWRKEWKIKSLVFTSKDRQKYFNVKGTLEGLYDFVKKYIDKSAARSDITISDTGWWRYNDDKHGLSVFLNDNSGVLEIDRR